MRDTIRVETDARGVAAQTAASPTGPSEAPAMVPMKAAFDVSRSRAR